MNQSLHTQLVRNCALGLTGIFLLLMGVAALLLTPLGWWAVLWLTSLPVRLWDDRHFKLELLGMWPRDSIGYLQLGFFWLAVILLFLAMITAFTILWHRIKMKQGANL